MATEFSRATPSERKRLLEQRLNDLKIKRAPFLDQWRDVAQFISPNSGRFYRHDHGEYRDLDFILDSEAGRDLNILASGLMSSASSPARPWFSLNCTNPDLANNYAVAKWCADVQRIILKVFQKSNTYNTLHSMYKELALFGIACDVLTDNYDNLIQHNLLTAGEYCVATDPQGNVNTLYREFELTTAQAVRQFGYKNLSKEIQNAYDKGNLTDYWSFLHAVEPRYDRDASKSDSKNSEWASYYCELETGAKEILSESGFDDFPVICPRWDVLGVDAYGTSPCLTVLPDVKQLQQETLRKIELIDQFSKPPLQAPNSARQNPISLSAGHINFTSSTAPEQMIKPIVSSVGDLNSLTQDIAQLRENIKDGLFVRQFLMLEEAQNNRKTTVEVYALKEEKMLVLGSVVERNNRECLGRLVELTYKRLLKTGMLPDAPDELKATALDVEFSSVLSQAQQAVDINSVDRMVNAVASVAQIMPDVLDRLDPDGYVDVYRERLGVDPKFLRSKDDADAIREQRQQAQAQAQNMEQASQGADMLNQLAQAQKGSTDASLAGQQLDPVAGGGVL